MVHRLNFEESISLYALGLLDGDELKEVDEHLSSGCALCTNVLRETESVLSLLPYSLNDKLLSSQVKNNVFRAIESREESKKKINGINFEDVVDLYANRVYELALKLTGHEAEATAVVENVLYALYEKTETRPSQSNLSHLIHKLTVRAAIPVLKRRKGSRAMAVKTYLPRFQKDGHHLNRPVVDWSKEGGKVKGMNNFYGVDRAVSSLAAIDRVVLVLSDVEGLSKDDISDILNLTVPTVKTKLHRSRLFLRGNLAQQLGYRPF